MEAICHALGCDQPVVSWVRRFSGETERCIGQCLRHALSADVYDLKPEHHGFSPRDRSTEAKRCHNCGGRFTEDFYWLHDIGPNYGTAALCFQCHEIRILKLRRPQSPPAPPEVPPQLGPGAIDAIAERLAEKLKLASFDLQRGESAIIAQKYFLAKLKALFPAREASLASAMELLEEYRQRL